MASKLSKDLANTTDWLHVAWVLTATLTWGIFTHNPGDCMSLGQVLLQMEHSLAMVEESCLSYMV